MVLHNLSQKQCLARSSKSFGNVRDSGFRCQVLVEKICGAASWRASVALTSTLEHGMSNLLPTPFQHP